MTPALKSNEVFAGDWNVIMRCVQDGDGSCFDVVSQWKKSVAITPGMSLQRTGAMYINSQDEPLAFLFSFYPKNQVSKSADIEY